MRRFQGPVHRAAKPQGMPPQGTPPWCILLKLWERCHREHQCVLSHLMLVEGRQVKCEGKCAEFSSRELGKNRSNTGT